MPLIITGPYRWVRHPGYTGALLSYLATSVFLDSYWAYLPALFLTVCLVLRTALEDRTLQNELAGYREYAGQTRYRLIPVSGDHSGLFIFLHKPYLEMQISVKRVISH